VSFSAGGDRGRATGGQAGKGRGRGRIGMDRSRMSSRRDGRMRSRATTTD